MVEIKILNCDEKEIERNFESIEEFIRVMDSDDPNDEPLMLDDEIIELKIDDEEVKTYYLVNDLYNAFAD